MPAPTRAPATRPSASSAGWEPRAIRGAREILSAGDPKAAWKLLDRVAQSWPQMTEVDHEKRRILAVLYAEARGLESSSTTERLALGEHSATGA